MAGCCEARKGHQVPEAHHGDQHHQDSVGIALKTQCIYIKIIMSRTVFQKSFSSFIFNRNSPRADAGFSVLSAPAAELLALPALVGVTDFEIGVEGFSLSIFFVEGVLAFEEVPLRGLKNQFKMGKLVTYTAETLWLVPRPKHKCNIPVRPHMFLLWR